MEIIESIRNEDGFIDYNKLQKLENEGKLDKDIYIKSANPSMYEKATMNIYSPYNELIAEEIAKEFGIKCAHYDIAKSSIGQTYVFSEDFKEGRLEFTFFDLELNLKERENFISDLNTIYEVISLKKFKTILEEFPDNLNEDFQKKLGNYKRKLTSEEIDKIMDDVNKIYVFNIIIANVDSNCTNYGILINEKSVVSMPSFDNEMLLGSGKSTNLAPFNEKFFNEEWGIWFSTFSSSNEDSNDMFLYYFLKNKEYYNLFKEKINLIDDNNIQNIIEKVESRTKSKMDEETKNEYISKFKSVNLVLKQLIYKIEIMSEEEKEEYINYIENFAKNKVNSTYNQSEQEEEESFYDFK